MIKHCPTCDRTSDKVNFIGEFCEVCVSDKLKKSIPDMIEIEYCKRCGRIKIPGRHAAPDKVSMTRAVANALPKIKAEMEVLEFDDKKAKVEFLFKVDGDRAKITKDIALKMIHKICIDDFRKSSGYYEAIVQLRGNEEVMLRMIKKITTFLEARDAFVTKIEQIEGGFDLYISDKTLTNGFFRVYDLKPTRSYTLYSIKNGKQVYRNTYALRV